MQSVRLYGGNMHTVVLLCLLVAACGIEGEQITDVQSTESVATLQGDSTDVSVLLDGVVPQLESKYQQLWFRRWTWHTKDSMSVRVIMDERVAHDFLRLAFERTYTFRRKPTGWSLAHTTADRGMGVTPGVQPPTAASALATAR